MKRSIALSLAAAAVGLAVVPSLFAEDKAPQRSYLYFAPSSSSGTTYRYRPVETPRPKEQVPMRGTAVSQQKAATPVSASAAPAPRAGQQVVVLRPVSWGLRSGLGSFYPMAIFGQVTPIEQQPASGTPAAPYASGINPNKYAYASRNDAGMYYSSAYNSGYYASGCYETNACCRCSRRKCTLFGGMFRGCGSGCYTVVPPPCPTACAVQLYYAPPAGTPNYGPPASTPAYGPATPPTPPNPTPPTPGTPDDNASPPQPIEKKVTPAPQARLLPRIPGLPPDA